MSFFEILKSFTEWLFLTSLKSTVVIALILIVQILLRKRLSAKWQHALWILLIVRLIFPVDIKSPLSVYNWTDDVQYSDIPLFVDPEDHFDIFTEARVNFKTEKMPASPTDSPTANIIQVKPDAQPTPFSFISIVTLIWLAIATALFIYTIVMNIKLSQRILRGKIINDKSVLDILARCQNKLAIKTKIPIFSLTDIQSPFSFGLYKKRIALPSYILDESTLEKLEHILMHELVHFKQKDIPLALFTTALQILHWFNPFIWIAFFKMRADRELACDELVLTHIGTDQNKQYGRTLISLIESASQRGLLPLAVGLADTKFNLKRRVTMISNFAPKSIWWTAVALFFLSTSAVFVLTGAVDKGNVRGTVTLSGDTAPDSIYVGIYQLKKWGWDRYPFHDHIALSRSTSSDFSFRLERGAYCITAWAYGYDRAYTNFVVPDDKTPLLFDFELCPLSLPEDYEKVSVVGDFCDWRPQKALPLIFDGTVWQLESPAETKQGTRYSFLFLKPKENSSMFIYHDRYSPNVDKRLLRPQMASFYSVYDGEKIELDPGSFQNPPKQGQIEIDGLGYEQQLNTVYDDFRNFLLSFERYGSANALVNNPDKFAGMLVEFDSLKAQYDPEIRTILIEEWFEEFALFHPFWRLIHSAYNEEKLDSLHYQAALQSKDFIAFMDVCMRQFQDMDLYSPLLEGGIADDLLQLQYLLDDASISVRQRYDIHKNYFEERLVDVIKKGTRTTSSHILYKLIGTLYFKKQYDKAEYYLDWMKREFADTPAYVSHVQNIFEKWLRLRLGAPAPAFTARTFDGDNVSLADYKGKFLFIDFWATWSGQSVLDVPDKINLVQSISTDSLVLLGLVPGDKEQLEFIKERNIPYVNAISNVDLEEQYGIEYLPTNYLIDPNGRILAKDLKGDGLTALVREQMRLYAKQRGKSCFSTH